MSNNIIVCGLFEWELVKKGLMKVGRCRDCLHYDGWKDKDHAVLYCSKKSKVLKNEKQDCKEWSIDTR